MDHKGVEIAAEQHGVQECWLSTDLEVASIYTHPLAKLLFLLLPNRFHAAPLRRHTLCVVSSCSV